MRATVDNDPFIMASIKFAKMDAFGIASELSMIRGIAEIKRFHWIYKM
jgi:hypothetical protein